MTQGTVLIVDDNPAALLMLRAALEPAGYTVVEASNGREALEQIERHRSRLIISDWEMPEMSGIELCREVRARSQEYTFFLLVTGHDSPEERVQGLSAGADDFISKPFNPEELRARLGTAERVLSLETRDIAIFAMAKLAESRDPETGAHLERVQQYARILAQDLATDPELGPQIDAEFIRLIFSTSPLHDIGKVAIPDSILLKPGRLSDREFEIMKSHTTIGAATLDAALDRFPNVKFLQMARDIAASHHERWDGTGYPKGLSGNSIPLPARIVAVADVYDALVSKRVYKSALAHEVARGIITEEGGSHFDQRVVESFLRCSAQFEEVRMRHSEQDHVVRIAA